MTNPLDDDGASNRKETEEARAILAALELELTETNKLLEEGSDEAALDAELTRIEAELTELRLQAEKVKRLKDAFRLQKYDVRRQARRLEMQSQDAKRALDLAIENERLLDELKQKMAYFEELTANAAWRARLFPHQHTGSSFLASAKRAVCADSMGLGKTVQAIAYLDKVESRKALVVSPGDVMRGWERELKLFAPQRARIIIGKKAFAEQKYMLDLFAPLPGEDPNDIDPQVYIINYESWARSSKVIKAMLACQFDTIILDESHEIKNPETTTFKGLKDLIYTPNTCRYNEAIPPETYATFNSSHYMGPTYFDDEGNEIEVKRTPICGALMLLDKHGNGMCDNGHSAANLPYVNHYGEHGKQAYADERSIKNVLCMSGTPILNNPVDIWTSLYFVNKDLFPYYNSYVRDYTETNFHTGKIVWRAGGESMLAKKIKGFYIRRTLADAGIVLPPQEVIVHEIAFDAKLYPKQAKLLEMLRTRAQIEISEGRVSSPMQMLALITRMRQAICWPGGIKLREPVMNWDGSYKLDYETGEVVTELINVGDEYRESIKLDKAVELINELNANNHRVIVFSQFKTVLDEMDKRLNRLHYLNPTEVPERSALFHGGTPDVKKDAIKRNFDPSYDEAPIWDNVLANFETGGVGVNFTKATAVVILDEAWNPGKNNQAYDRVHRIGQDKETQVHIMRVDNSMDIWMAELIQQKAAILGSFDAANVEQGDLKAELAAMFDKPMDIPDDIPPADENGFGDNSDINE